MQVGVCCRPGGGRPGDDFGGVVRARASILAEVELENTQSAAERLERKW